MVTMQPHKITEASAEARVPDWFSFSDVLGADYRHHAGMKVLCSTLPLGEMRARFGDLFMFSFLLPPIPKVFFPQNLELGVDSACHLTLTPRTVVAFRLIGPSQGGSLWSQYPVNGLAYGMLRRERGTELHLFVVGIEY